MWLRRCVGAMKMSWTCFSLKARLLAEKLPSAVSLPCIIPLGVPTERLKKKWRLAFIFPFSVCNLSVTCASKRKKLVVLHLQVRQLDVTLCGFSRKTKKKCCVSSLSVVLMRILKKIVRLHTIARWVDGCAQICSFQCVWPAVALWSRTTSPVTKSQVSNVFTMMIFEQSLAVKKKLWCWCATSWSFV